MTLNWKALAAKHLREGTMWGGGVDWQRVVPEHPTTYSELDIALSEDAADWTPELEHDCE